jgi:ATP-binding cassette subfamily B protein
MRYNRTTRPALQEVQQRLAELTADAEEGVTGIRIVKAFAREQHQMARFRHSTARLFDQNMYSTRLRAFYNPLLGFLPNLGLVAVLLVGGQQVINGGLTLGEFSAFYIYLMILTFPMRMLGVALGMSQRAIAGGNRLFEVLDREPRITSAPDAPPLPEGQGKVEIERASLRYADPAAPGREAEDAAGIGLALEDIDLTVEAGRTLATIPKSTSQTSPLLMPGIFDGEHRFEIHETEPGRVRFVQGERFTGLLVPFLQKLIEVDTATTFTNVNAALAARVIELRVAGAA